MCVAFVFFFKQKTAYEMRISDWSSDVCSSDLFDGILMLVARNDRRVRIEVGYGLAGVVPDAIANRIIDETIVTLFKAGDYAGGLDAGVDQLLGVINGETLPPPPEHHSSGHTRIGADNRKPASRGRGWTDL